MLTFSAVAHDQGLLNPSRTAWFDASLCLPTSRGLPSSTSVASKNRSFGPPFASHIIYFIGRNPREALEGIQWRWDRVIVRSVRVAACRHFQDPTVKLQEADVRRTSKLGRLVSGGFPRHRLATLRQRDRGP